MSPPRPLRVVVVVNELVGGIGVSLAELLPRLADDGITATVVCLRPAGNMSAEALVGAGIEVRGLEATPYLGRTSLGWARQLRRIVRKEQPDLVHTTVLMSGVVARCSVLGTGVPVLTSLVMPVHHRLNGRELGTKQRRVRALWALDAFTARHATAHFHALSETVKASAVEKLRVPPERITVIMRSREPVRLPPQTPELRAAARAELGIPEDAELVVTVARQGRQKGQVHLLEAAAILRETRPALLVLVAGREDRATPQLRARHAALGLGDRVRFLGHRDDVGRILAAADVFAFPSIAEGLGGAVVEAMAVGLPIVASDLGPIREVTDDGRAAELVPPADPPRLAEAIARLLDDRARAAELGARARAQYLARLTPDRIVRDTADLYRRVARAG